MKFYMRIENGEIVGYPMSDENLVKIIGEIDDENLPQDLLPVEKTDFTVGVYEVYEGSTFEIQADKVVEKHLIRPMTDQEKTDRQNAVKLTWQNTTNFANWNFSEERCQFVPPVEYPEDGKHYRWNDESVIWEEDVE